MLEQMLKKAADKEIYESEMQSQSDANGLPLPLTSLSS